MRRSCIKSTTAFFFKKLADEVQAKYSHNRAAWWHEAKCVTPETCFGHWRLASSVLFQLPSFHDPYQAIPEQIPLVHSARLASSKLLCLVRHGHGIAIEKFPRGSGCRGVPLKVEKKIRLDTMKGPCIHTFFALSRLDDGWRGPHGLEHCWPCCTFG